MLDGTEKQEIIIIKRGGDGDGGHHGGAWKIAFADFMTAMMALFLVLWLVNAANEETKKSVASYFNPVKLVDRNPSARGLDEAEALKTQVKEHTEDAKDVGDGEDSDDPVDGARSELELFRDPFKVLDQIASDEMRKAPEAEFALTPPNPSGSPREDAFLDPFAQLAPPVQPNQSNAPASGGEQDNQTTDFDPTRVDETETRQAKFDSAEPTDSPSDAVPNAEPKKAVHRREVENVDAATTADKDDKPKDTKVKTAGPQPENRKDEQHEQEELRKAAVQEAMDLVEKKQAVKKLTGEIAEEIKKKLAENLDIDEKLVKSLTVEATSDGVLISITDQLGFSMFEIGSALPRGQLVLAMDQISSVLTKKRGAIRVYGHTDARPYQGDDYDNWRLSTARAHAARFMLERGGLGNQRISRVAGFADRKLRIPDDPEADANRRIEILLEVS